MRVVVDLQGAQSDSSRGRGIGRYSRALTLAMARDMRGHELVVLLNGGQEDAAAELRDDLAPFLPPAQIVGWRGPGQQSGVQVEHAARRRAAERIRARVIDMLRPDILMLTSAFEGYGDDSVTTMPADTAPPPTVGICYDLIPLLRPDAYLPEPRHRRFYFQALLELQNSRGLLTISESSKLEIIEALGIAADRVANIWAGVGSQFRPAQPDDEPQATVLARYGLQSGYVLTVGAVEQRKNLLGLITAYAQLPPALRRAHKLVATGWNDARQLPPLRRMAAEAGLGEDEFRLLTTYVPDTDLPALYRGSAVTVMPSLHEGFGLPVAEAMACGAAVICSNTSSLPEVVGRTDATFDPADPADMAAKLRAVLERRSFREELRRSGPERASLFTWDATARRTWDAIERFAPDADVPRRSRRKKQLAVLTPLGDDVPALREWLLALTGDYEVVLVSADGEPPDLRLTATFPVHPPTWFDGAAPERVILLPGDDPYHLGLAVRLSYAFAAVMQAPPRPITAILNEAVGAEGAVWLAEFLLDAYGWQGAVAAREGAADLAERYPLEPILRARLAALVELPLHRLTPARIEQSCAQNPRQAAEACSADLARDGLCLPEVARALATTFAERRPRSLFLDVTTVAEIDHGTGIQRVVREIARLLGRASDVPARVELVRSKGGNLTAARAFGSRLYGVPDIAGEVLPVSVAPGDVYVCLDFNVHDLPDLRRTLLSVRAAGGQAVVVIYDLLPVLQAQHFVETVRKAFPAWLALISTHADALLCISRTVAEEMLAWLDQHPPVRRRPLRLGWFHLGADFSTAPEEAAPARRPELLMVGTVEPRKGHVDALDAMETVWRKGGDLGLVIVGRAGWHTEALQARLRSHPERGQRLRWLENADDDEVSALYRRSAGLLMASEGEGFGLPLVEAAHAGLPVIARDLPIFREIAGDGALYFEGGRLAETIERWMALREEGRLPDPSRIIALSWAEASRRVAQIVMEGDWYAEWPRPRLTETAMQVAAPAS